MPDFSVVVTVRNDAEGLAELLPALEAQTLAPCEVIVVDGGSRDATMDVLRAWEPERFPVRVAVEPGSSIAEGRNAAVRLASCEWIACTDAGCCPEPEWLAALGRATADSDIVGGIFIAEGLTPLERVVSVTHYPVPDELEHPNALVRLSHRLFGRAYRAKEAGGRSMAFSKSAWAAVGGFPEETYAGEDLAFTATLVEQGFTASLAPGARVRWRPPGTWGENARMFFTYCRGDIRHSGRTRHAVRALAWSAGSWRMSRGRAVERVLLLGAGGAYLGLPLQRARRAQLPVRDWWRIPAAVALKDLSQLAGAATGILDAARGIPQPNPQPAPQVDDDDTVRADSRSGAVDVSEVSQANGP